MASVPRQRSGRRARKKRSPSRLVGWEVPHSQPITLPSRACKISAATSAALKMPALNQREAGDGRKLAMSAADPCPTGNECCEQATTDGNEAERNLLHDVLSHFHSHRRDRRLPPCCRGWEGRTIVHLTSSQKVST